MHRDAAGVWHANVTVFGAWSAAIGYTLDHVRYAPPVFRPRTRTIERGLPWFTLVEVELPANDRRDVPLALAFAAVTGTTGSDDIENHLFACADAVIFHAETVRAFVHRSDDARRRLDRWIEARAETALVIFQLDRSPDTSIEYDDDAGARIVETPPVTLDVAAMRDRLAIGSRPVVETDAYHRDVRAVYRQTVDSLLAARDRLGPRPAYA